MIFESVYINSFWDKILQYSLLTLIKMLDGDSSAPVIFWHSTFLTWYRKYTDFNDIAENVLVYEGKKFLRNIIFKWYITFWVHEKLLNPKQVMWSYGASVSVQAHLESYQAHSLPFNYSQPVTFDTHGITVPITYLWHYCTLYSS